MTIRAALKSICLLVLVGIGLWAPPQAWAQAPRLPAIAVTELSYESSVKSHFSFLLIDREGRFNKNSTSSGQYHTLTSAGEADLLQITRGEMHQFTGDIKGGLIKSGQYKVVQGKAWTKQDRTSVPGGCFPPKCTGEPQTFSENVTLFDIVDRIKKGFYPGADFVLFGTVTNIEDRQDSLPVQGTNAVNNVYAVELVADFSLINKIGRAHV